MKTSGRIGLGLLCLACLVPAVAQETVSTDADLPIKQQALRWIDRFEVHQVLFNPQDVQKLRDKVAELSDEEVQKWWDDSAVRRELLDDPEWLATQKWLREFLQVQAIYSDEQIRYFQSDAFQRAQESPRSLKEVMDEITAMRRQFAERARMSEATRRQVLASQEAFRQDAVRQREAATLRRSPPPVAGGPIVVREQPVRYNRPLVTSLDVARWSVLREVFPRW